LSKCSFIDFIKSNVEASRKMNKKLNLGLLTITVILTAGLMFNVNLSMASYPGPDAYSATTFGQTGQYYTGEWVQAGAQGNYISGDPNHYGTGRWTSMRGVDISMNPPNPYNVQYNGYLWFTWSHYDGSTWTDMQWYSSLTYPYWMEDSGSIGYATMVRSYSYAQFYVPSPIDTTTTREVASTVYVGM
jgi:hypothetical protein